MNTALRQKNKILILAAAVGLMALLLSVLPLDQQGSPALTDSVPAAFAAHQAPVIDLRVADAPSGDLRIASFREVSVFSPDSREVSPDFEIELVDGKALKFNPKKGTLKPGRYHIEGKVETSEGTRDFSQDFYWGVLAMNFNKAVYQAGEEAYLQMAVLDDNGNTICGADLKLQITTPTGKPVTLFTPDLDPSLTLPLARGGEIIQNPECGPNNVIDTPDYYAYYDLGEPGIYQLTLTAQTPNGERTIQDFIEVLSPPYQGGEQEGVFFDVERTGPTRIYPLADYQMKVKITAREDFQGIVREYVPDSFKIIEQVIIQRSENIAKTEQAESRVQNITNDQKEIIWDVDLKAGQEIELSYIFDAPDISPEFYLLGPLEFKKQESLSSPSEAGRVRNNNQIVVFKEARQWQVAGDAATIVGSDTPSRDSSDDPDNLTLPTSIAAGDLIVAFHFTDGSFDESWPGSWVEIKDSACDSDRCSASIAYLIASGGETSVNVTKGGGERFTAITIRISAASWHGTTPPEVSTGATGDSANPDPDSVTASWGSDDNLFIAAMAWDDSDGGDTVDAYPTNYTSNQTVSDDLLSAGRGAIATRELTASNDDPGTFTTSAAEEWWAGTVVVRPAAGNNTPTISSVTDTPDPTNPKRSVTFSTDWDDADSGELVKAKVCKTDSLTSQVCDGGFWASSTAFTTSDPEKLTYDVAEGDHGQTRNYYIFVCDDEASCSSSSSGAFSVNAQSTVPNIDVRGGLQVR